jgi:hypothetical protein
MTTTLPLFGQVHEAIGALRRDLIDPEDGPRISTMRNYRFAIVQYDPKDEYAMRLEVQKLIAELVTKGWFVLSIDLQKLLLDRVGWPSRAAGGGGGSRWAPQPGLLTINCTTRAAS